MTAPKRRGRPPKAKTAEAAVLAAESKGEEIATAEIDGKPVAQRPFDINGPVSKPKPKAGERVRVYNKIRAKLFTSDGCLEPESEGDVLVSDFEALGDKVIRVS